MAEVIGVVASVATLSKIIKYSATTIKRIRDAPSELLDLSQQVEQLSLELEILHELQNISLIPQSTAAKQIWALQQNNIIKAQTRILSVQNALTRIESRTTGVKGKIQWLIISREEASNLLQNLLQIRMALTSVMSMSSCLLQQAFHAEEMRAIKDLSLKNNKVLKEKENISNDATKSVDSNVVESNGPAADNSIFQSCSSTKTLVDLPVVGRITGTMTTLKHHQGIITWVNFRILRDSTIAVVKLVEEDSDFMIACGRGDVDTMERMLQLHQATPNEITLDNRTPIGAAVESGKTEAVKLLLRYGSDVNVLLGRKQSSPLVVTMRRRDVEMARLLLTHGACDLHVTAIGWTPLFYLWSKTSSKISEKPAKTLLTVLSNRQGFKLSHREVVDTRGYGLIHMAALRGTPADIHALIKCGVDPFLETGPARWQAVHFAVLEGRNEIFEALISYYAKEDVKRTDAQGWTLLHISAISGHLYLSRRLLELGVDQHALTDANILSAPEGFEYLEKELRGRQWTALQLAALQSTHRQATFLQAISSVIDVEESKYFEASDADPTDEDWADASMYIA